MKKFLVQRPIDHGRTAAPDDEVVYADYQTLQGGNLIFKNTRGDDGYPHVVKIYAAGSWSTVRTEPNDRQSINERVMDTFGPFAAEKLKSMGLKIVYE